MITCREATKLHTLSAEKALEGVKKLRYDAHMVVCPGCRRFRKQLETAVGVLSGLPREAPPANLVDLLAAELDKEK